MLVLSVECSRSIQVHKPSEEERRKEQYKMVVKILTLILRNFWGISRTAQYPNNYCDLVYIQSISNQCHQHLCDELITRPEKSC